VTFFEFSLNDDRNPAVEARQARAMKLFREPQSPFRPADTSSFTGTAQTKLLASDAAVHVYQVRFEEGGRTNWHTHSGVQWLVITDGRVRVQCWGELPHDLDAGDAVVFAPGEKHWHGAVSGSSGSHTAVNIDVTTTWLEPVSEEDYRRSSPAR